MEVVIRKGQKLKVIIEETAKNDYLTTVSVFVDYDTILSMVSKPKSSRKSLSEGRYFSRNAALVRNAFNKGVWSTGRNFDMNETLLQLTTEGESLSDCEILDITDKGITNLSEIGMKIPSVSDRLERDSIERYTRLLKRILSVREAVDV
jgi:hypothetical protein